MDRLGRYDIIGELGSGGMATVYRVRQAALGRDAALKALHDDLARNPEFLERFKREARLMAQLPDYRHVVQVFDLDEDQGKHFYVMELIALSLAQHIGEEEEDDEGTRIRRKTSAPLPIDDSLRLLEQILNGLEVIHRAGVVHRDLCPRNILLQEAPHGGYIAKISDFGISGGGREESRLTRTGEAGFGKEKYAAPEQLESLANADPRSDIFSVGMIAYRLLAGRLPPLRFKDPAQINPDVPPALNDWVLTCLEEEPQDRFPNAAAALARLKEGGGTPVPAAEEPSAPEREAARLAEAVEKARPGTPYQEQVDVSTQGITDDLSRADGAYDGIERGRMGPMTLYRFLERVRPLKAPEGGEEDDICPAHVLVEGLEGQLSFVMEGGRIEESYSGDEVSLLEAVERAFAVDAASILTFDGRSWLVDQKGEGDFTSIIDAVEAASEGDRITVRPGRYLNEQIYLDKALEVTGEGPAREILVECREASVVVSMADGSRISGLTLATIIPAGSEEEAFGINVTEGALEVIGCDVTSNSLSSATVQGEGSRLILTDCSLHNGADAGAFAFDGGALVMTGCDVAHNRLSGVAVAQGGDAELRKCRLHHGRASGIYVYKGNNRLRMEDCDVFYNENAGIEVRDETAPVIRNCRFYDGKGIGLFFSSKAGGLVEECRIWGNGGDGVNIDQEAHPVIKKCEISNNQSAGVRIEDNGKGVVEECDIHGNDNAGVVISGHSHPKIRRCEIHDGAASGIFGYDNGRGVVEDCDIRGNALAGLEVKEGANPLVRRCRVRDGKEGGLFVNEKGRGTYEECDISGNVLPGVETKEEAEPVVLNCKIRESEAGGVFAHEKGYGTFKACAITGNALPGVEIKQKSRLTLEECRITGNGGVGVLVSKGGGGTVEDCDLTDNAGGPWDLPFMNRLTRKNNKE